MIRINQLKLPIAHTKEQLEQKILKTLKISREQLRGWQIVKQSIDARKKPQLNYVYAVDVETVSDDKVLKKVNDKNIMSTKQHLYRIPAMEAKLFPDTPIIVGAGPAGLFCAYAMVLSGLHPIVLERGRKIELRTQDVNAFWEDGRLNPASNVQFGEGGAGTFSDGKLNTLVKDPLGRNRFVLETFVKFGAPQRILYENKPHIGTDILADVIRNMRIFMEQAGAKFLFEHCMTDIRIDDGAVTGVEINHTEWIDTNRLVLAIGHSARDTFRMLAGKEAFAMEAKSFAVGFRVEHPQEMINLQQYGDIYYKTLPAAPYKVTANLKNKRGIYSFCMCPGGYVVNASSEEKRLAVNGMSYSGRDGKNANSAIIVSVTPDDFVRALGEVSTFNPKATPGIEKTEPDIKAGHAIDALLGVRFQEMLEEKAYLLGGGKIPQQLFGDFCKNQVSLSYGSYESAAKGQHVLCNLRGLLPAELEEAFIEGMHHFAHAIPSFDRDDVILSGVESRTSSPVRIWRNEAFMAPVKGVYPCGEGAGYAGGIMSAAMDGLKVAETVLR